MVGPSNVVVCFSDSFLFFSFSFIQFFLFGYRSLLFMHANDAFVVRAVVLLHPVRVSMVLHFKHTHTKREQNE